MYILALRACDTKPGVIKTIKVNNIPAFFPSILLTGPNPKAARAATPSREAVLSENALFPRIRVIIFVSKK